MQDTIQLQNEIHSEELGIKDQNKDHHLSFWKPLLKDNEEEEIDDKDIVGVDVQVFY